jgi:hypothetical protein
MRTALDRFREFARATPAPIRAPTALNTAARMGTTLRRHVRQRPSPRTPPPPQFLGFEGDEILADRVPTQKDLAAGERILFQPVGRVDHPGAIALVAAITAQHFANLDESAFVNILKGIELGEKGPVLATEIFGPEALHHLGLMGELAPPAMLVLAEILALAEIGHANHAKAIADRRRMFYTDFSHGIAAGLAPDYHEGIPTNLFRRRVYEHGKNEVALLNPRERWQLRAYLVHLRENPRTLEEFKAFAYRGDILYDALKNNIFERGEYLTGKHRVP